MQHTHQSLNQTSSVEGVMLTLALCHCFESLSICECSRVIQRVSITRWISYDSNGRDVRPMSVLFMISSAPLPAVLLLTAPSCGFRTFSCHSTLQVKLLFEERI